MLSGVESAVWTWFAQTGVWLPSHVPVPPATPLQVPTTCSVSIFDVLPAPMLAVFRKVMLPPTSTLAPVIWALFDMQRLPRMKIGTVMIVLFASVVQPLVLSA